MTQSCTWPACLSREAQQALADEVTRQMSGEPPSPPAPDQRAICGCPAPTALRHRFAAAIASYDHAVGLASDPTPRDHHYGQADAETEIEQLRARVRHVADQIEHGAPWTASREDTAARVRDAIQPRVYPGEPS